MVKGTQLLVYGVLTLALASSWTAGYVARRLSGSPLTGAGAFAAGLLWWLYRVAGGPAGISRTIGSGRSSVKIPFADGPKRAGATRVVVVSDTVGLLTRAQNLILPPACLPACLPACST
jgi:hypothetical protein